MKELRSYLWVTHGVVRGLRARPRRPSTSMLRRDGKFARCERAGALLSSPRCISF